MTQARQILAEHFRRTRERYPRDPLVMIFDIDGTVLDVRRLVQRFLHELDREDGSSRFAELQLGDVTTGEDAVESLLQKSGVYHCEKERILERYYACRWSPEILRRSHQIYIPVYDLIQWLQRQPFTFVGLNTARHPSSRQDTLQALDALGHAFGVRFSRDLIHMNPAGDAPDTSRSKVEGLRYFENRGYRVVGVVDSEPNNVTAMAKALPNHGIVFLQTDALLRSSGRGSASGSDDDVERFHRPSLVLAS